MIPPFTLVQLSTIPQERWRGLPVFHPMDQRGDKNGNLLVEWLSDDMGDHGAAAYDVGVVIDWEPDDRWSEITRVRFLMSMGDTFIYASCHLWVPKELT